MTPLRLPIPRKTPARHAGKRAIVLLGTTLYVTMALMPLMSSGYYSDDMWNSTTKAQMEDSGISLFRYLLNHSKELMESGRPSAVAPFVMGPIAYMSYNLLLYKGLILLLTVSNVLLFGYFLLLLTRDRHVALIGMLLIPLFFQFRLYHDPILSFMGLMQVFVGFTLAAAVLLCRHLRNGDRASLVVSVVFFNLSLYLYELSLPLVLVFLVLIAGHLDDDGWRPRRKAFAKFAPYAVSAILAILAIVVTRQIRNPASTIYSGVATSFNTNRILRTWSLQSYASLPLSYFTSDPSQLFPRRFQDCVRNVRWEDTVVLAILIGGFLFAIRRVSYRGRWRDLLVIGALLLFSPALMIAMTSKYQSELPMVGMGMGYIPVYLQYFGALLLAMSVVGIVNRWIRRRWTRAFFLFVLLGAISIVAVLNLQANRLVVEKANVDLDYRRTALSSALEAGLLSRVPANSTLLILDDYTYDPFPFVKSSLKGWANGAVHWRTRFFVLLYSGRRLQVFDDVETLMASQRQRGSSTNETEHLYLLKIKSYPDQDAIRQGYVILSKIEGIVPCPSDPRKALIFSSQWESTYGAGLKDRRLCG
jgi:hypothetical protein